MAGLLFRIVVIGCLGTSGTLMAGSFSARIDKTKGVLGDSFELSLTVSGSAEGQPQIPEIDRLEVSSRGHSTNISIINGSMSREKTYIFSIDPQEPGEYTIPSLSLKVDGEVLNTVPISFQVAADGMGEGDVDGNGEPPLVYLSRSLSNLEPFPGEPIVERVTIRYRGRMEAQRVPSELKGVRVFDVEGEEHGSEAAHGTNYSTITISRILVPLDAGTIELPAFRINTRISVPQQRSSPRRGLDPLFQMFNDPFHRTENRVVSSGPVTLKVKSFPEESKPAGFNGVSGAFQMTSKLSHQTLSQGETNTLTVTIEGDGLLDNLGGLPWQAPKNVKVYPDQPEAIEQNTSTGVRSQKIYRYALVPTQGGRVDLGSLNLPVFDYKEGSYVSLDVELGTFDVEKNPNEMTQQPKPQGVSAEPQLDITLGEDLNDIKRRFDPHRSDRLTSGDFVVLGLMTGVPMLMFLGFVSLSWFRRREKDPANWRREKAFEIFTQKMKQIEEELTMEKDPDLWNRIIDAYRDYCGNKFSCRSESLTNQDIFKRLQGLNLSAPQLQAIQSVLQKSDQLRYSNQAPRQDELKHGFEIVKATVEEMEKKC